MSLKTDAHANLHSLRNRRQAIAASIRQLIDDWDRLPTLGNRSEDKAHEVTLLRQALAALGSPSLPNPAERSFHRQIDAVQRSLELT